jgi:hypothetical protein
MIEQKAAQTSLLLRAHRPARPRLVRRGLMVLVSVPRADFSAYLGELSQEGRPRSPELRPLQLS